LLAVHAIYTDFKKAFDMVDHQVLITKLSNYGVCGPLIDWFSSYLSNRVQQVRVKGYLSGKYDVRCGVPQGSHLGPLLFTIFINDIGDGITSNFCLFADDLKLYRSIKDDNDCSALQSDLFYLSEWCFRNNLSLNEEKCYYMVFSRGEGVEGHYTLNGSSLERTHSVRDLGVILDSKLSFTDHIAHITLKVNKLMGFIVRVGGDLSIESLKLLYMAYVRAPLEYASVIWCPNYQIHIDRLEATQKRFVRYVRHRLYGKGIKLSSEQTLTYLGLDALEFRRRQNDLCFFFKTVNNLIDSSHILSQFNFHVPYRQLRSSAVLETNFSRTVYGQSSPINRITRLVNEACNRIDFFNMSLKSFKKCMSSVYC
jgi:ribonucleases P/MRP protein subunit RPP40